MRSVLYLCTVTDRISVGGNVIARVCPSVRPFVSTLIFGTDSTLCLKKRPPFYFCDNFVRCLPIFIILSLAVAIHLRYDGPALLENYYSLCWWKNFENWYTLGQVTGKMVWSLHMPRLKCTVKQDSAWQTGHVKQSNLFACNFAKSVLILKILSLVYFLCLQNIVITKPCEVSRKLKASLNATSIRS